MPDQRDATIDIPRVLRETSVSHVHYLPEMTSTNEVAMERAVQLDTRESELVLTSRQTAGKGRGSNRWFSTEGSLTFSLITPELPIQPSQTPQVSLVAGLAGVQAAEAHAPSASAQIKWPNDVYLNGRKAAGVLIEVPKRSAARFVIGVGFNVNNSLEDAPEEVQPTAISLAHAVGRAVDATGLLIDFLNRLEQGLKMLAAKNPLLPELWSACSFLTGKQVRITLPNGSQEGRCQGIAADGALMVQAADGVKTCYGGVVQEFS